MRTLLAEVNERTCVMQAVLVTAPQRAEVRPAPSLAGKQSKTISSHQPRSAARTPCTPSRTLRTCSPCIPHIASAVRSAELLQSRPRTMTGSGWPPCRPQCRECSSHQGSRCRCCMQHTRWLACTAQSGILFPLGKRTLGKPSVLPRPRTHLGTADTLQWRSSAAPHTPGNRIWSKRHCSDLTGPL